MSAIKAAPGKCSSIMRLKDVCPSVWLMNIGSCKEGSPGRIWPVRVNTQPTGVRWQSDPAGSIKKVSKMQMMMIRALRAVQKNQTTLLSIKSLSLLSLFQKAWHPPTVFPSAGKNQFDLFTA